MTKSQPFCFKQKLHPFFADEFAIGQQAARTSFSIGKSLTHHSLLIARMRHSIGGRALLHESGLWR
jgi:hypothetical protein